MEDDTVIKLPKIDYSLVGKNTALAIAKGLADASWYTSPVPKEKMRELLERRDGPAIRDTLLWFALLIFFGGSGYLLWGTWWASHPVCHLWRAVCVPCLIRAGMNPAMGRLSKPTG